MINFMRGIDLKAHIKAIRVWQENMLVWQEEVGLIGKTKYSASTPSINYGSFTEYCDNLSLNREVMAGLLSMLQKEGKLPTQWGSKELELFL